jgi:hypothetical protein
MLLWRLFQGHDRERYYKYFEYFEVQQASGSSLPMLSQKKRQQLVPQAWQQQHRFCEGKMGGER